MSSPKERQKKYARAEAERQAEIRKAKDFKALIDSHLELGLSSHIVTSGEIRVFVRQNDDRMSRLLERKSWTIPAGELQKLDDKELKQLILDMEKA